MNFKSFRFVLLFVLMIFYIFRFVLCLFNDILFILLIVIFCFVINYFCLQFAVLIMFTNFNFFYVIYNVYHNVYKPWCKIRIYVLYWMVKGLKNRRDVQYKLQCFMKISNALITNVTRCSSNIENQDKLLKIGTIRTIMICVTKNTLISAPH